MLYFCSPFPETSSSSSEQATLDLDETLEDAILDAEEGFIDVHNQDTDQDQCDKTQHCDMSDSLYEGSRTSVMQAYLMIFQFVLKHHLTGKTFTELLLLLKILLPHDCRLPKSVYGLKCFFIKVFPEMKVIEHQYCRDCHQTIESG